MLNKVILIGRMTRDPDQRGKDPEKPIASFRIAVDRDYKRDGEPEADFFDCSVFGQQAKFVLQYGRKGRLLCVVGAIQRREWQDQQTGEKRSAFEVVRTEVKFLDRKPEDAQPDGAAQPAAAPAPVPAPAVGYAPQQAVPVAQGYPAPPTVQPAAAQAPQPATVAQPGTQPTAAPAPQAVPTVTVQALGYPQPVPGAAAQYPTPDFSGVPESYAWGPGGVPAGNPPF